MEDLNKENLKATLKANSSDKATIMPTKEELDDDSVSEFYRILNENFDSAIEQSPMGGFLFNQVKSGSRTVYSKTIRETKVFEKSFIPILESAYRSISKILKDPKKAIRYEQEVVPMEKVKKVNAETVRHLASHTQFIKEVKDDGDIIPSKLLTTFAEDEIGIYENRFIKTLINRICKFLSLRIQILKKNLDSYETKNTTVTNSFKVDDTKVKVELTVKMERQLDAQVKAARETFEKASSIYDMFKSLRSSKLMQDLKNYKEVSPPIMKTNIILKNAEFKVCYNTWVFLDRYTELAFDVNVKEKKNPYPDSLAKSVDGIMSEAVGTMLYFNGNTDLDPENMPYKEFTTRKARMLAHKDDEYKFNPSSQKIEKFEMSEYFLNKTQEFYQQSIDEKINSGMEKKYSLELVFREMQEVVNSIYPPLFEVPIEDEFADVPLQIKLERARKKAEVLETITHLKEIDYNNTLKENDDTLAEIQNLEEKIKQQEAREKRLAELARQKSERAEKRAREREEAQKLREAEAQRKAEERARIKAEADAQKAEEKARADEAKQKLIERRAQIKAEADARKAERAAERARKAEERARAEAERKKEEERIAEEERQLELEKAHMDAKELLKRRREIIRQKAQAEREREEARQEALRAKKEAEDDEDNEDIEVRELDEQINRIDNDDDIDDDVEETLDTKSLIEKRKEALRQKALANKNRAQIVDEDEEERKRESVVDAKTEFQNRRDEIRRRALEAQKKALADEEEERQLFERNRNIIRGVSQKSEVQSRTVTPEPVGFDQKSMFERNREIIRKRALAAQMDAEPKRPEAPKAPSEPEMDPKELLKQRREAIRQKALESQKEAEKIIKARSHEDDADDEEEIEEGIDPKEILKRRREAIKKKAMEASLREKKARDDGFEDVSADDRAKILNSRDEDDDEE